MPKRTPAALMGNRAKLRAVLLYHVVAGKRAPIRVAGGNLFVNSARVTTADVMASNGVVHVVDRLLVPPAR